MSDRMRWGSGSDWDNDWGGGCAPCPPASCPPPVCTTQPCPPVACPPCPPPWFGPPRPPWYPGASGGVSFGTTPPQFPIRGHFWWDGATLHMWDGVEWETIGPGGSIGEAPLDGKTYARQNAAWVVSPTSTITFGITQPGTLTIPVNAWTQIPYTGTPTIDIQNAWDASTKRLTPKKPGIYLFEIREYSTVGAGGTVAIELVRNDAGTNTSGALIAAQSITSVGGSGGYLSASGVSALNGTTDYVRLWAYTSGGTIYGASGDFVFLATLLP
jgi:hypothetical protein